MNDKRSILIIFLFILPIYLFGIVSFFADDPTISYAENRTLLSAPDFSFEKAFNSSLFQEYELYLNDTFPMRDVLIRMNSMLNAFYYGPGSKETLVVSNDFQIQSDMGSEPRLDRPEMDESLQVNGLIITEERVMEQFTFSKDLMSYFAESINRFKLEMPDKNIYLMIPPSAAEFYAPDHLKKESASQKNAFEYLEKKLNNVIFINPYEKFENHLDEYIFFRTDHHWTARGAYYGYEAICESFGIEPVHYSEHDYGQLDDFLGSLYKSTLQYPQSSALRKNPDFVEYFVSDVTYEATSYTTTDMLEGLEKQLVIDDYDRNDNKYNVFSGGDSPLIKITTDVKNGQKLILVRDSYGHAILPFLIENYEEIYAIEPRYFNVNGAPVLKLAEFADQVEVNDILFMNYAMFSSGGYWFSWLDVLDAMSREPIVFP